MGIVRVKVGDILCQAFVTIWFVLVMVQHCSLFPEAIEVCQVEFEVDKRWHVAFCRKIFSNP